jgi:superfamily II DNA/RNA helicase
VLSSSFADLGVPAEAVRALHARGIDSAFPIQSMAIPPALLGEDICGRAPTGSGKTIAFGIPVAQLVRPAQPGRPTALILAPTRELASQIEQEMALLLPPATGKRRGPRVAAFYGGVGFGQQLNALRRGVDVVVACPGRLKDLIARGAVSLADVHIVVIDEADRMADMGFLPEVRKLLDQVRPDRQTMLFSATLDGDVDLLVRRYQRTPRHLAVEPVEQESTTDYHWVEVNREQRVGTAASYIATHGPAIVFCRTKHGADRVARQLVAAGVKAVPLHGGRSQSQRERALSAFVSGRAEALVATDVAARGIHVDGVGCVVHFDLPTTAKDYVHRSGRTGRAGSEGVVFALVTPADSRADVRALQKAVGHEGAVALAPPADAVMAGAVTADRSDRSHDVSATATRESAGSARKRRPRRGPRDVSGAGNVSDRPGRVGQAARSSQAATGKPRPAGQRASSRGGQSGPRSGAPRSAQGARPGQGGGGAGRRRGRAA